MHNVVFRDNSNSVVTWSCFRNKKHFNKRYNKKMKRLCQVVEEGVSRERAIELCSTPEATKAAKVSQLRELIELLP